MGFLSVIWTVVGYDSPFHLGEECSNTRKWFKKPKINVEHLIHTQTLDGSGSDEAEVVNFEKRE
jgi:hypothetical protein